MSDTKKYCSPVKGVGCSVSGCRYHTTENCCCAEHIEVRSERAVTSAETFCSTFTPCSGCAGDVY